MAKPTTSSINREAWLSAWVTRLRTVFGERGLTVPPKIRVTCGFPARGALAKRKRVMGQCWAATASKDKHFEVFVSPLQDGDAEVAEVVAHEVGHAVAGTEAGHKAAWKKVVRAVGLTGEKVKGPLGEILTPVLAEFVAAHGHYPHARLTEGLCGPTKKQTTRMLKCECGKCGYTCRTTQKWLAVGAPICPKDKVAMIADEPGDEPEGDD